MDGSSRNLGLVEFLRPDRVMLTTDKRVEDVYECSECGALVLRAEGHERKHELLNELLEAIEEAHRSAFQLQVMLFVGVLAALILALVAL